jgi:hypothetical protein
MEIVKAIFTYIDIPTLVLLCMLFGFWFIARTAQARPDFDFGNMLKDPEGKESVTRLGMVVAIPFTWWGFMADTMANKAVDPVVLAICLACWSGTPVAMKLGDAIVAKWTK